MLSLKSWSHSDIGRKRTNNEDAYFDDVSVGLFMVADGMGGHRAGDQASNMAILAAERAFKDCTAKMQSPEIALVHAVSNAAKAVYRQSLLDSSLRGMGTTLSALAICHGQAFIAHIGDTRIYCFRNGGLHQLTRDHSLVNDRILAGLMTKEEARTSTIRHIITKAIGHSEHVEADHFTFAVEKNDIFILCSDGLNNMLPDSDMVDIIKRFPPSKTVRQLILEANRKGGDDNITVILVKAG